MRMKFLAFIKLINLALAKDIVKLNAVKVFGDGKDESFQSDFGPHVLIDVKERGDLKRDYIPIEIKYTQLTYFVEFEIGSNKDKVLLSLDSGSADFWVNSANNEVCLSDLDNASKITNIVNPIEQIQPIIHTNENDNTCYVIIANDDNNNGQNSLTIRDEQSDAPNIEYQGCLGFGVFNFDNSTTFKESDLKFDIKYGDNSTSSGIMGTDDIYINGIKVPDVTIGINKKSTANGILGLGFPVNQAGFQLDNQQIYDNLPTVMKKNGLINKVVYSLKASIASDKYQSELIFGGYDKNSFEGQLTLLPIIDYNLRNSNRKGDGPYYISITLNSITFDNESNPFAIGAAPAILDSGSVGSFFPTNIILSIVDKYGFEYSDDLQGYVITESKIKDSSLKFNFQGVEINVPLIYFTYPVLDMNTYEYSNLRLLSVVYYNGQNIDYFILGDDILSMISFVVDMEKKQVAIGQANLNQSEENIIVVIDDIPDAIKASEWDNIYGSDGKKTLSIVGKEIAISDIDKIPSNETVNLTNQFLPGYGIDLGWI